MVMNTIDSILKLIDAGFTKEEINNLLTPAEPTVVTPTAVTPAEPTVVTPTAVTPAEPTVVTPTEPNNVQSTDPVTPAPVTVSETDKRLDKLASQVEALIKTQQAINRANTSNTARVFETTDDILEGLINPRK